MKRDFKFFLIDIINAIERIFEFTEGMDFGEFVSDDKTASAVVRKLEIIGEATKNLPESITSKYMNVPWREMARMQDKIIHFYFGIDYEIVWKVIKERLPEIHKSIKEILQKLEK